MTVELHEAGTASPVRFTTGFKEVGEGIMIRGFLGNCVENLKV